MKKVKIDLGMLVRVQKTVTVLVPDDFDKWNEADKECFMSAVYDRDEGDGFVEDPNSTFCDEAGHCLLGKADAEDKPMYRATSPNDVVRVEEGESEDDLCEECGEPIQRDPDGSEGVWVHGASGSREDKDFDADENHGARPPEGTVW